MVGPTGVEAVVASPRRPIIGIPTASPAVSGQVTAEAAEVCGWSLRETAGAAATVELWNGNGTGGERLFVLALAANGSSTTGPLEHGIDFGRGVYLEVVAGSVNGAVWVRRLGG